MGASAVEGLGGEILIGIKESGGAGIDGVTNVVGATT